MKKYAILLLLSFYVHQVFSQCPPSALKVETPECKSPQDLQVKNVNCDSVMLIWKGGEAETYIVKAHLNDSTSRINSDFMISNYSCNADNACKATIFLSGNQNLSWSVQSICSLNKAIVYSETVNGRDYTKPLCYVDNQNASQAVLAENGIKLYPNPAVDYLIVDLGKEASDIECSITDASGKKVYDKLFAGSQSTIKIKTTMIAPGTYTLIINYNNQVTRAKFIKLNR